MKPDIRYVRSADGTTLAVATLGSGPVVLECGRIANFFGFQGELADPRRLEHNRRLAERNTVVLFDSRGVGLSQREVDDVSLEAHTADLSAVIESMGVSEVALKASSLSLFPAIRYAVAHSDRVSRLILTNPSRLATERQISEGRRAIAPLFDYDFDLWVRVLLLMELGWKDGAAVYEASGSGAITKEMFVRQYQEARHWDISGELSAIQCPTLVVYVPSPDGAVPLESVREVAASIPHARFKPLTWDIDTIGIQQYEATQEFLGQDKHASKAAPPPSSGMAVILFADIAGSTALTESIGDAAFREKARSLEEALRNAVRDNGGATIDGKLLGDGVLATFPAAAQAIAAALACAEAGARHELPLHLGVHAGDVIRESDNVFGGAVNIAARISSLAAPGEVLVSDIVRGLGRTSAGVRFDDRGEHELKGIADPIRVFEARIAD